LGGRRLQELLGGYINAKPKSLQQKKSLQNVMKESKRLQCSFPSAGCHEKAKDKRKMQGCFKCFFACEDALRQARRADPQNRTFQTVQNEAHAMACVKG